MRLASALLSAVFLAIAIVSAAPAFANEFCDKEMMPLLQARQTLNDRLTALGKQAKQPGAREKFCGTLTQYIGNIRKTLAYMQQNKDFCGIPAEAIDAAKKGLASSGTMHHKVCVAPPPPREGAAGGGGPAIPRPPVELRLQ